MSAANGRWMIRAAGATVLLGAALAGGAAQGAKKDEALLKELTLVSI